MTTIDSTGKRIAGRSKRRGWKRPTLQNVNITKFAYDYIAKAEGSYKLPIYDKLDKILLSFIKVREEYAEEIELKNYVIKDNTETLRLYRGFIQSRNLEEEFKRFYVDISKNNDQSVILTEGKREEGMTN